MLTLLGLTPAFPLIEFDNTPAQSPALQYNAASQTFNVNTTPTAILPSATSVPTFINPPSDLEIHILVSDPSGNLIGGNGAAFPVGSDFYMSGSFTYNGTSYSGTLLTGNVLQFGYQANTGTSTSQFDFRFETTGGQLTTGTSPLFPASQDTYLDIASENSTFTGSFSSNFQGGAKGELGPVSPLPVAIYGYKFDDVNDTGVPPSMPSSGNELSGWTIDLTGTNYLGNPVSLSTTTTTSTVNGLPGEYSFTGLLPGTYTLTEVQQNGWTQTTGGTTITLTSGQVAVAYSGEEGTLPSGGTQVVTPLLAFGNFHPTGVVIGMGKSPATPKNISIVNPITGTAAATIAAPYGSSFLGGVNVATGDLNGNGYDDIVTAPGRTGSPVINVYDQFGNLLTSFQAYPSSVNGGVNVAVADLTGNGLDDIITVPAWGPAEVRVFMNMGVVGGTPVFSSTPTYDFLAFPSSFIGGATVAASSESTMPGGSPQIIVGSNAGMKTTVEVFNVNSLPTTSPPSLATPMATFYPFSTATQTFTGGVSLAVAQLTSTPVQSIVVGAGAGGQSLVNIWGYNGATHSYTALSSPGVLGFPAFTGPSANSPINVATLNGGGGIASAILAVQSSGGTTGQVSQLNIASVSPLVLSSPVVLPNNGGYPAGPDTIAVINNVEPGATFIPVVKSAVNPAAATTAKPAATPAATLATTTAKPAATPAATPATATAVKSAAAVISSSTNKNAATATKPLSTASVALLVKKD